MSRIPTKSTTTEPAPSHAAALAALLRASYDTIGNLLGSAAARDRFVRCVTADYLRTVARSPEDRAQIESCEPSAYVGACMMAAAEGLLPGEDGWIAVDDEGRAEWRPSWRGLVKQLRRALQSNGAHVEDLCAEVVYHEEIAAGGYDEDRFARRVRHRPWYLLGIEVEPMPERIACCYAAATIVEPDGTRHREYRVLTAVELRKREQLARIAGGIGAKAWDEWFVSQCRSAALRALAEWLPRGEILPSARALAADADPPLASLAEVAPREPVSFGESIAASVRGVSAALGGAAEDASEPAARRTTPPAASPIETTASDPADPLAGLDGRARVAAIRRASSPLNGGA